MFLYLIAFVAALLTIFGLPSARNSLRDFSNTGYNQLLDHLLPAFRALLPLRNEEFPINQETPGDGEEEELFIKEDILSERETGEAQDVSKSMNKMSDMKKKSAESFTFDYKTRKYDSNPEGGSTRWNFQQSNFKTEEHAEMIPQDMWNILNTIPVPNSEGRHAEYLYEALWKESMKVGTKLPENDVHNDNFNKTKIIDEATFEKMYEQPNRHANHEDKNGHHLK